MMTRRACLSTLTAAVLGATRAPGAQLKPSGYTMVNSGEHALGSEGFAFPYSGGVRDLSKQPPET
jgi:hypothetical protein